MERDPFDLVGDTLEGQFRVLEVAGEGDLSVVYKGHHLGVDATVAIKCLNLPATLDAALVEPLIDSFREASRLHYRLARGNLNIAQSIASGSTLAPRTGTLVPYLVREWFEGESLRNDLRRRSDQRKKGRSLDDAIKLLEPAVEGVAYAHTQDVVHLSLHPSNFFIAKKGTQRSLKVLDFGVARTMNELAAGIPRDSQPSHGLRVLFPGYAAPEQLDQSVGPVGPATDVYAMALVIMEVLSDRPVMPGQETGTLVDKALDKTNRPTPRAHGLQLPKGVEAALTRAVSLEPGKRQKNVATFWNDVRAAAKATSRAAPGAPSVPPSMPPSMPASLPPSISPESESEDADEVALGMLTEYRPRAATLMGIAPAGVAIQGAGGSAIMPRPSTPPEGAASPGRGQGAVETQPLPFEPFPIETPAFPAPDASPNRRPPPPPPRTSLPTPPPMMSTSGPRPRPSHPRLRSRSRPLQTITPIGTPIVDAEPPKVPAMSAPPFAPPGYSFAPQPARTAPASKPGAARRLSLPFIVSVSRIPPLLLAAVVVVSAFAITVVYAVILVTLRGHPKPAGAAPSASSSASVALEPSSLPPATDPPTPSAPEPPGRFIRSRRGPPSTRLRPTSCIAARASSGARPWRGSPSATMARSAASSSAPPSAGRPLRRA